MSSLYFIGNETSYLNIPNTSEFNFGTGDFTIEWYQYQTDANPFPRIFQVGSYEDGISIGVSIEMGEGSDTAMFYYWSSGPNGVIELPRESYINKWVHFAICRVSGITNIYMNGTSILSMEDGSDFNSTQNLVIGNEAIPSTGASFGGYLYYFSWVKGISVYPGNFTVTNAYPTVSDETVFLLKANEFVGTLGEGTLGEISGMVENNNVTTSPTAPGIIPVPISQYRRKPTYTDNSLVFYKAGSLAAGGVGSVRNSSIKSRRV